MKMKIKKHKNSAIMVLVGFLLGVFISMYLNMGYTNDSVLHVETVQIIETLKDWVENFCNNIIQLL